MNILYGLAVPDAGQILLDGKDVEIASPHDAIRRGISMVHQHFMLVPVLSVAENILLGEEPMAGRVFLDRAASKHRIKELGDRFGWEIDPDKPVGSLSVGWQQRVEILKALYRNARVLVLDEPTAVLTPQETKEIFERPAQAAGRGLRDHLHQPQAVRGAGGRRPHHRHPARQGGRQPHPQRDRRGRPRQADGRSRRGAHRRPRREPSGAAGAQHRQPHRPRRSRPRGAARRLVRGAGRRDLRDRRRRPGMARTSWWRRWSGCATPPAAR